MSEEFFFSRDLSWLEFNSRVLHEAEDERTPLLERVRFLSIFTSNLDEFLMKRVGALNRQSVAGLDSSSLLRAIRQKVIHLQERQAACFTGTILPELAEQGIHLLRWNELSETEMKRANDFYRKSVFPVLTPIAVDPGHPFPLVSNLSTSLGLLLQDPDEPDKPFFARVKVPRVVPQWIPINRSPGDQVVRLMSLQDLITQNLRTLFPETDILGVMPFRVTRNSDIDRDEEDAEDLLEMVTDELRERRFAKIVRLEHGPGPHGELRQIIMDELQLTEQDVYEVPALLDYTTLQAVAELNRPALKYAAWVPATPPALVGDQNIWGVIRSGDILVHHPYESFTASVERFISAAVSDPQVLAVKMTLYRIGEGSPFIPMLIRAAEAGKQVACLVEIKARFDEERNIAVARSLENAGVHVVYGVLGYKTHCKIALVVREEAHGLRSYVHVGTGNYHSRTSRLYTDLGLFTVHPGVVEDVTNLFNHLTGRASHRRYEQLLVAPSGMKDEIIELINREAINQAGGKPARIVAKMNQLEDRDVIRALYGASRAGVPIDLIVRGFCTLRPGVPGLSENIRVISVIGRFLEHSRLFHFANGRAEASDGLFYLGSADWMSRNLVSRVEAAVPVLSKPLRERCWQILSVMLNDHRSAWELRGDGTYEQRTVQDPAVDIGTHATLMNQTRLRAKGHLESGLAVLA